MTIHTAGGGTALFCTRQELRSWGLDPFALTGEDALSLLRRAARPMGLPRPRPGEVTAFPGREGVLIFAHHTPGSPFPGWPAGLRRRRRT